MIEESGCGEWALFCLRTDAPIFFSILDNMALFVTWIRLLLIMITLSLHDIFISTYFTFFVINLFIIIFRIFPLNAKVLDCVLSLVPCAITQDSGIEFACVSDRT